MNTCRIFHRSAVDTLHSTAQFLNAVTALQLQLQLSPRIAQHSSWNHSTLFLGTLQDRFKVLFCSFFFPSCSSINSNGIHCHLPCHTLQAGRFVSSLSLFFSLPPSFSLSLLPSHSFPLTLFLSFPLVAEQIEDKKMCFSSLYLQHIPKYLTSSGYSMCSISVVELNCSALWSTAGPGVLFQPGSTLIMPTGIHLIVTPKPNVVGSRELLKIQVQGPRSRTTESGSTSKKPEKWYPEKVLQ